MPPRPGLSHERDAVAERRARVMELTRRGWFAWQIAYEMGITERTVQRYRDHERAGRPPQKQRMSASTLKKIENVHELLDAGMSVRQAARELKVSKDTIWRRLRYLRAAS